MIDDSSSQAPALGSVGSVPAAESPAPQQQQEQQEQKTGVTIPGAGKTYRKIDLPTPEQMAQEEVMNNCATRTVLAGAMGSVLGVMFGLFMGTMDTGATGVTGPVGLDGLPLTPQPKQNFKQVVKDMAKNMGSKSLSYAKGFAVMGALFAGSECVIEKARAKHDMYNSVYAGCATGAVLAHSGGPKAMCVGCATFAAFSAVIDKFMGHND